MKRTIIVSAPGKLIISGEHSVVYGRRALVTSIDKRLYLRVIEEPIGSPEEDSTIDVNFHDTNRSFSIKVNENSTVDSPIELQSILFVFGELKSFFERRSRLKIDVRSDIPIGAGLGSSGAFSVCLAGAFFHLAKGFFNFEEINDLAFRVECLFHGTPSGIDNTISTFGKSLIFDRQNKKIVDFQLENLVIIDTGLPKSTKTLVANVRQFHETCRDEAERIFDRIQSLVDVLLEDSKRVDEVFIENQELLRKIQVSIPQIDRIVEILREHGVSCKITGAGGGGCLIAHVSPSVQTELLDWLQGESVKTIYFVRAGVQGLKEENQFEK